MVEEASFEIELDTDDEVAPMLSQYQVLGQEGHWQLDSSKFIRVDVGDGQHKKLRDFYHKQNDLVDQLVCIDTPDAIPSEQDLTVEADLRARQLLSVRLAIYGSLIVNIALFVAKVVAVVLSGSIVVIASAVDSFLDLLSGAIIFITAMLVRKRDVYLYPAGNSRVEPLGIIIFASSMFTANFQVIVKAVETVIDIKDNIFVLTLETSTIVIVSCTIVLKLVLWIFCALVWRSSGSESVKALAQDHRNDVISNGAACASLFIAYYKWKYMDPLAAFLVSIYLMYTWFQAGREQVVKLSGRSAGPELLTRITYMVWQHSELIVAIDTVRAYHLAHGFLIEVDIVLPSDMSLREAHDIGQALQDKIEALPEAERCFVHLDWETDHTPEHNDRE